MLYSPSRCSKADMTVIKGLVRHTKKEKKEILSSLETFTLFFTKLKKPNILSLDVSKLGKSQNHRLSVLNGSSNHLVQCPHFVGTQTGSPHTTLNLTYSSKVTFILLYIFYLIQKVLCS